MAKNKEAFIRYRLIDEALRDKQRSFPKMQDLIEKCEEMLGKSFSESSIQKDIYAMRFDNGLGFHAPIKYSKIHSGYHYTEENYSINGIPLKEEELDAIEFAAGVLKQFRGVKILAPFDSAIDKILQTVKVSRTLRGNDFSKIIQVEQAAWFQGSELIEPIVKAILNRKVLSFNYQSFSTDRMREHILHAYVLREYRNRWYMVGWHPEFKKVRTFGLDRISNLQTTKDKYYKDPSFDSEKFFAHSFGITVDTMKPTKFILSFTPLQGKYIKAQPMHGTQKTIADTKKEFKISINVIPSQELKMAILSYGKNIKVVGPKWVKGWVKG